MTATIHQILSHAWPDRGGWRVFGDEITAGDGGPVPTIEEIESARPAAETAIHAIEQAEAAIIAARKVWPNAAAFLGEFSMPELGSISLSLDPTIAALRLLLASWPTDIWSDDPRIIGGLAALIAVGIITEDRRAQIVAK